MNLIKIKNCPQHAKGGAAAPPFHTPPLVHLVGGARRNLTKFLSSSLKVVPGPSEAFLVALWIRLTRSPTSA